MSAACAELRRRGHPVFRVYIDGAKAGLKRETWAIAATADEPVSAIRSATRWCSPDDAAPLWAAPVRPARRASVEVPS